MDACKYDSEREQHDGKRRNTIVRGNSTMAILFS